ncbi:MAG: tRNA (guanosine(37)-N1)-methyltransferase TrmD [Alphaproteobacteria bacterium]|nr:tRNA (guanosine(37)-N1)-methyltransferase TrmD [Alphaproteobacteria bacterium]
MISQESLFHVNLITLFPEIFPGILGHSLIGKAHEKNIWSYATINIRDFAVDSYGTVDDVPFGGGAGMILRPDVIQAAIRSIPNRTGPLIYFTPRGQSLTQNLVKSLIQHPSLTLLCGRYEGVDERIFQHYDVLEISLGDFILTNGDIPAFALLDACIRLLPGVIGKQESLQNESFESGLLEHPLYTKPVSWEGLDVPEILRSGHHGKIDAWRHNESIKVTRQRRPDLWIDYLKNKLK